MKVLLLNPPSPRTVIRDYYCSKSTKSNYLFQPIDLLMQSGVLAEAGHELHAIDAVVRQMTESECLDEIERIKPDAVLGLWGAVTDSSDSAFYRKMVEKTGAPLFATGEVFLEEPERWLRERDFVKGALLRFVSKGLSEYLATGKPGPDLMVREEDSVSGGLAEPVPSEFSLGRPRHELFGYDRYRFSFARGNRFATVLTDFGCPFKCGFCVMACLGYRLRPADEVVRELRWLRENGIKELFVTDQCFGARKSRSIDLCERIHTETPGMGWTTFTRADLLDDTLLTSMKKAGCHTVIMGVETADQETLSSYSKGLAPEKVKQGFRMCRQRGIRTVATFILGLPEDTEESIKATMKLARELDPDFVSYNVAVPRSGTSLARAAREEGLSEAGVDADQGGDVVVMKTRSLERERVAELKRKAIRDFYLRPTYLARRIFAVRSARELLAEAREGLALLGKNI